jgi:tetratricopeptide (TPR) repeat protein
MPLRAAVVVALSVVATAGVAAAPAPAPGPTAQGDEAGRHSTLGQRQLERGQYQDAIAEFRRAYELRADPRFLHDIAEAYRQLGIVDRAVFFYERYLAALPDAPDRAEVEATIAGLREARPQPAGGAAPAPVVPSLAHDVVIVPLGPRDVPAAEPAAAHAARRRPVWRRWWVWTALGVAVVAGLAAVALTSTSGGPVAPTTELGGKRFF